MAGQWGAAWLSVVVPLLMGCLHMWEVSCYHHGLDNLTVLEQKVAALKTENAFYYSYFEEVVEAPSLREAVLCSLQDRRSEAPAVINAIHRFNIYQEVMCGLFYRLLSACVGRSLLPEPWYFFRYCSYVLQGIGRAALAQLVFTIGGGGLTGGLLPCIALFCWLFLHQSTVSRIHDVGMLNLRENWAMPVILCQVLCLHRLLVSHPGLLKRGGAGSSVGITFRRWVWAFRLSTLACLLLWQFSAFAFMLQVAAVFLCALLACEPGSRCALDDVLKSHLLCAAVAAALLFGNELLVHHMLVTECVAIFVVLKVRPRPPSLRLLFWIDGVLAVLLFGGLRVVQSRWATADEHVAEIFMDKLRKLFPDILDRFLGQESTKEPTFNARLYKAVSVFDFISWDTVKSALPTKLYHFAGAALAIWLLGFLGHLLLSARARGTESEDAGAATPAAHTEAQANGAKRTEPSESRREGLRRRGASPAGPSANDGSSAAGGGIPAGRGKDAAKMARDRRDADVSAEVSSQGDAWANAFGQGVFLVELTLFLALGCFISRLKVIGVPLLCALAASAASPRPLEVLLQPSLRRWPKCGRWVRSAALLGAAAVQLGQLAFLARLMPFRDGKALAEHTDVSWSDGDRLELYHWLAKRLPAGTTVITSMPLSAELRLNTWLRSVIHPQFEDRGLRDRVQELYEYYMCVPPQRMGEIMRKYDSRHIILEYKRCDFSPFLLDHHPEFNCQKEDSKWKDLFCPVAHVSPHFEMLFANAGYVVLRLRDEEEIARVVKKRNGQSVEIHEIKVWSAMLNQCLEEEGDACIGRTAELASMFYSKLKQRQVAEMLLGWVRRHADSHGEAQFIIGHHLDYNADKSAQAGQHYRKAYELAPDNPYIAREYLMWVDLVANDNRTLEAFLRPRRFTRGGNRSLLDLQDVTLSCEAAVAVRNIMRDVDWAEELWEFAVGHGIGSKCVKNNWQIMAKGKTLEASLGNLGILLNIFWHRRMRSEISSVAGSGVRHQLPRPAWRFGLGSDART